MINKQFIFNIVRKLLPESLLFMRRTYKYRVELTGTHSIAEKLFHLIQSFRRAFIDRKTILFYPEGPMPFCVIYKIMLFLGYRITTNPRINYNLAIKYWLGFDGNPFAPEDSIPAFKGTRKNEVKLLNINCSDISKKRVNSIFEEVFGYSISVDPLKYTGKCVMKSNWNALHDGRIIECPVTRIDSGFVYVKLIHNETEDGLVKDMRVPVYGNKTPLVYLKYRPVKDRFVDRAHTNKKAVIAEISEVLSEDELRNIHRFCNKIGMDYGEVDVLRDSVDGRIYIVDANIAPSGPPSPINSDEAKVAVTRLSRAFEDALGTLIN